MMMMKKKRMKKEDERKKKEGWMKEKKRKKLKEKDEVSKKNGVDEKITSKVVLFRRCLHERLDRKFKHDRLITRAIKLDTLRL